MARGVRHESGAQSRSWRREILALAGRAVMKCRNMSALNHDRILPAQTEQMCDLRLMWQSA
jgi:hypothetical protein